ncbi:phosphoribosylglycinamide formyltransferase [Penaeicola halotolerans]|uniref:phosphoribosylglycinamide formyltransferase n=1 Tax=Penaeicola halotolerans TaxID=2793196 RepID=UPI001CF7EF39|nr:phosphoribosylglycinamide formyltransferase [Penaeicola halotolerans]
MKKIMILASGSGSNAEQIMKHFQQSKVGKIALIGTNNPKAGVIQRAARFDVPVIVFSKSEMADGQLTQLAKKHDIDLIVLAGFLLKIPEDLIHAYPQQIVNIHPALLPKYGGKGMYGHHVHEAVKAASESESGITIHLVNEHFDEGKILFQAAVQLEPTDSPEMIAQKVLELEHKYFPKIIEDLLK